MNLFRRDHLTTDELSAYLDDRGSDRGHLSQCETCRAELASLEATRGYLGSMREVPIPRSFVPLVEAPAPSRWSWLPAMRFATAGVAVALLLSVGFESYAAGGTAGAPSMAIRSLTYDSAVQEKAATQESDRQAAPASAPQQGLRSAPAAAPPAATATSVPVPQEVPAAPPSSTPIGPVSSTLGVLFVLLFAATLGLWIRERSH